jgi:septum formation protein
MAAYHAKMDPLDKAGAYAAQEHGDLIIERISGSMTNVVGLPMDEVTAALERHFGIRPAAVRPEAVP